MVEPMQTALRELRAADLTGGARTTRARADDAVHRRCAMHRGHPLVIRNAPLDATGDAVPHDVLARRAPTRSRRSPALESDGWIAPLNERVRGRPAFREAVERAHAALRRRSRGGPRAGRRGWGGVAGTRTRHEVPARPLREPLRRRRRSGGAVGGRARRADAPRAASQTRVAAIDQGTNSIRLLVAEPGRGDDPPIELARDMVITRLGQGVDAHRPPRPRGAGSHASTCWHGYAGARGRSAPSGSAWAPRARSATPRTGSEFATAVREHAGVGARDHRRRAGGGALVPRRRRRARPRARPVRRAWTSAAARRSSSSGARAGRAPSARSRSAWEASA